MLASMIDRRLRVRVSYGHRLLEQYCLVSKILIEHLSMNPFGTGDFHRTGLVVEGNRSSDIVLTVAFYSENFVNSADGN